MLEAVNFGCQIFAARFRTFNSKAELEVFLVPDEWEIFARYEYGDDDASATDDLSIVTVGFNRYFDKHALKWTTDVGYSFNEVAPIWSSSGAGWRA